MKIKECAKTTCNCIAKSKVLTVSEESINKTIDVLNNGGVAIIPADTVYGFFTTAFRPESIERVYQIKRREKRKPFVIYTNKEKVDKVVHLNDVAKELIDKVWPKALSLILPKKDIVPEWYSKANTLGVMTAQNPVLSRIIQEVKEPIIGTTCNISGEPELKKAEEVIQFINQVDIMLADDQIPIYNKPSTMVDCTITPPKIIRLSSLSVEELQSVLPNIDIDLDRRIK